MFKRYTYTAYPTLEQTNVLNNTFGCTRFVYNKYVETNLTQKKLVSYTEACRNLTTLKGEYEWLNQVSSIALQQTLKDATQGVKNFFKNPSKVKPPKYKKKGNRETYRIVGVNSFKVVEYNRKWGGVKLPKMGYLKFRLDRSLPSVPSSVTVVRSPSGKVNVSFVVEVHAQPLPKTTQHAGVDLGLNHYATIACSNGSISKVENPRYYRKTQTKLGKAQAVLAKTQKGSSNREKQRYRVAKLHEKIVNQRKDFIYKLVSGLVCENQTITTETLAINNMVKNHNLAKSIMDASWGMFLTTLSQKCVELGREHFMVDQYYPSTKTCHVCGVIRESIPLSVRQWVCECGATHDRDVNAGLVLLAAGRAERVNAPLGENYTTINMVGNPTP